MAQVAKVVAMQGWYSEFKCPEHKEKHQMGPYKHCESQHCQGKQDNRPWLGTSLASSKLSK